MRTIIHIFPFLFNRLVDITSIKHITYLIVLLITVVTINQPEAAPVRTYEQQLEQVPHILFDTQT